MLSADEFRDEVSMKLLTATKTDKPKELEPAHSTYILCRNDLSIPELSEVMQQVATEAFPSHANIRQLLTIYADRLRWHVLPGENGMDERDTQTLIAQTQNTEQTLAKWLIENNKLRVSLYAPVPFGLFGTVVVDAFYVHLRLLNILDILKKEMQRPSTDYRQRYQSAVDLYWSYRLRSCSASISKSRTEVTVQDSGRTFIVRLTKRAPEAVQDSEVKQMYLKKIIYDCDFIGITFGRVTIPKLKSTDS